MENSLIFLDVESTGLGLEDRLCQVAYSSNNQIFESLFKPELPISIDASSINHITNKMLVDKSIFQESDFSHKLIKELESKILVAHNAKFDIEILSREGIKIPNFICTYKISKYLNNLKPQNIKHNLQYLRYYFNLEINAVAHDAKGDILVLKEVFYQLLIEFKKNHPELKNNQEILDKLILISRDSGYPNLIFSPLAFGKYKGKTYEEIAKIDRGYLKWFLEQKKSDVENDRNKDIIFTLNFYLNS